MTTRTVTNEADRRLLLAFLSKRKLPFAVEITDGRRRSVEQNALSHKWYAEAAQQFGDRTHEDVRGYCKLHHGVPILRASNEKFREAYDRIIRPLSYEDKLKAMTVFDFPVTRMMSVSELSSYLDAVFKDLSEQGIVLTIPPDRYATEAA